MKPHDTIVVLGGWIVKENNKWRTTGLDEKNEEESLGDNLRVVAANILYQRNGRTLIMASGGKGRLEHVQNLPPVAEVIKEELIELGVKAEDIILETKSKNTFEQLLKLGEIIKKEKLDSIAIITNKYHLPRVKAMTEYNLFLKKRFALCDIIFKDAESILLEHDSKNWEEVVKKAYQSEAMKQRLCMEETGVAQIRAGTYNYR